MKIEEANRILEQDYKHTIGVYGIEPVDKDLLKEAKKALLDRILNDLEKEDGVIGLELKPKGQTGTDSHIGPTILPLLLICLLLTAYAIWVVLFDYNKTIALLAYIPLSISNLIIWWYLYSLERKNLKS